MSKKTTLILFYSGVALICVAILCVVNLIVVPHLNAEDKASEAFLNVGQEKKEEWYPIEKDLVAKNQAGETVKLSDLRGKVWVVAQFFAICPHCAVRNGAELRRIYDQFKDSPDFQMVCISVDPERDDTERLAEYAEALGADVKNWWFLNAGEEKFTHEYLKNTLKFMDVRERIDPQDIEANGKFQHDMGLMAVDRDFNVIGKWSFTAAKTEEGKKLTPGLYERLKTDMSARVSAELAKDTDKP